MNEDKIIELWRQGYSVDQITNMSMLIQKTRGTHAKEKTEFYVRNFVEKTILKYQSSK